MYRAFILVDNFLNVMIGTQRDVELFFKYPGNFKHYLINKFNLSYKLFKPFVHF